MRKPNSKNKNRNFRGSSKKGMSNSGDFDMKRFRRGDNTPKGKSRAERRPHEVVCDSCGKTCEVPFAPTRGKPIYCDDCFKKKNRDLGPPRSGRTESRPPRDTNLEEINRKLDKIMKALDIE